MPPDLEEQFVQCWESASSPPDLFEFLASHRCRDKETILALIEIDQDFRSATQQTLPINHYVKRLPAVVGEQETSIELAIRELSKRRSTGETIDVDQFVSQFGSVGQSLRAALRQLEMLPNADGLDDRERVASAINKTASHINTEFIREEWIDRYRLIKILGRGAFGQVYLAVDSELQRQVAVKLPSPERFQGGLDVDQYLAEARTVARLDHPHIVSVYDVGKTNEGLVYVVSQYIQGSTVKEAIAGGVSDYGKIASWLSSIAAALQHAHERQVIHRDVKPANILIQESDDKAFLADFGLAIREDDYLALISTAGTPAYMSPEQARAEGHRLDGRTDIFSLGVVMYELLTGQRPFRGSTAEEMMHQIVSCEPILPRQIQPALPAELERICLKMLAKPCSERYASARDVVAEIDSWDDAPSFRSTATIVPRGLRAFRSDDADFFLSLLPGPYDRRGLPESIRFWKENIETHDPEHCFSVGILLGPSGCGKSSLIRAGLIPALDPTIRTHYVEATAADTEKRILRQLRKQTPTLPESASLVEALSLLRKQNNGHKSLIIIDQLEQWLHAHQPHPDDPLVRGLRQADGQHVQVLLSVRDDFGMAATRLMKALDTPIVEGENFATVDLFPREHAQKVFERYGQAYGQLPTQSKAYSASQREFIERVITGLAVDERVVCVQLTLFAEMVKTKSWTAETLSAVGGTEGIGVSFLEEVLGSRVSNPAHKLHAAAAQRVLHSLLPGTGSDIKGHMRSYDELLREAGYAKQPAEFRDLLRILDGELRLITPTEPEGLDSVSLHSGDSKYYQLTHDYLVQPLRKWLTATQMKTRRGRVSLRLADRAALFKAHPERRYLPTLAEYVSFLLLGKQGNNSSEAESMMRSASRYYGLAACATLAATLAFGLMGWRWLSREYSQSLVENGLMTSSLEEYPQVLERIEPRLADVKGQLKQLFDESGDSFVQLKAALALLNTEDPTAPYAQQIQEWLFNSDSPADLRIPLDLLLAANQRSDASSSDSDSLAANCWQLLANGRESEDRRFRAACILAQLDPGNQRWNEICDEVAKTLVSRPTTEVQQWAALLSPAQKFLHEPISLLAKAHDASPLQRQLSVQVMAKVLAKDQPQVLIELAKSADVAQLSELQESFEAMPHSVELIEEQLELLQDGFHASPPSLELVTACSKLAVLIAKLDIDRFPWQLLAEGQNRNLRSRLIDEMSSSRVAATKLMQRYTVEEEPSIRTALLLILGHGPPTNVASAELKLFRTAVEKDFSSSPNPGLHSAVDWLTQSWQSETTDPPMPLQLTTDGAHARKPTPSELRSTNSRTGWFTNQAGMTFSYFRIAEEEKPTSPKTSGCRWVAIGTREITRQQWLRFSSRRPEMVPGDHPQLDERLPDMLCPMAGITWFDAAHYCNWLSGEEGLPKSEWCYAPNEDGDYAPGMRIKANFQQLHGYRLPTVREWTLACQAGEQSLYAFGDDESLLAEYAWFSSNSNGHAWPVAVLKPNDWGLFDLQGNIIEWCQNPEGEVGDFSLLEDQIVTGTERREMRGGAYSNPARETTVLHASNTITITRNTAVGLRIARTLANCE